MEVEVEVEVDVEVEVETLDQVREALDAGADILLLDNFSLPDLEAAVALTAGRAERSERTAEGTTTPTPTPTASAEEGAPEFR